MPAALALVASSAPTREAAAFLSPSPAEVGEAAAASVRPARSSMSWA
jgi:hypothetical protein